LGAECAYVGCDAFVGVVGEGVGRGVGAAVAHTIWGDDVEAEGGQEGNLIAPAKGEVGEAMNQNDGTSVGGRKGARRVQVAIGLPIEMSGAELDSRVMERLYFVGVGHSGVRVA
jgi:hypothetical protein